MSVQIVLDDPRSFYSNLDFIKGRVILSLNKDENVSAILVKLEGESRSALMRPVNTNRPRERATVEMENHKLLYKVAQVFPSEQNLGPGSRPQAYTLGAGKHEYPFRFKFPFNNSCSNTDPPIGLGLGLGGIALSTMQQLHYRHVRRTLPPSLTGYPDMAEIRYYVKVTVQRPSLFKENRRSAVGFRFLPIEPPRPHRSTNEVFARRKYEFQPGGVKQKSGIFNNKRIVNGSQTPPMGEVEARLPSPAIVTCNEPIPLRIIVRNLNESPDQLFLMSLQVNLIGSTDIRAQDVARTETNMWAIMTLQSLAIPIGKPGDKVRTETILDRKLWDQVPLPNTVAPSFHTCNLSRRYELEVRVVLGYRSAGEIQPQTASLPLRFQIEVYSGISPPAALLDAMASQPAASVPRPQTARPPAARPPPATAPVPAAQPVYDPAYPPQLTTPTAPEGDAPPSYEDVMADDISPADGPRREYSGVTDVNASPLDEKAPAYSAIRRKPPPGR